MSRIEAVELWLREVVVAQNLCPFAGKPLLSGQVLIQETTGAHTEALLANCLNLFSAFYANHAFETALFILPNGYEDFFDYLDLADTVELLLEESFQADLRLATFHPEYQFAEFAADDVVHHIHRSPYPLLHILREESIARVKQSMDDTSAITSRNHKQAKILGVDFFNRYLVRD